MGSIVFLAYALRTIRNILYHLYWWDLKEWRLDRMVIHLKSTAQGKRWMFGPLALIKWILILLYATKFPFLNFIVYFVYLIESIKILIDFHLFKVPKPFLRPKIVTIFISSIIIEWIMVMLISFDYPYGLSLLIGDKLLPVIVSTLLFAVSIPFYFYKRKLKNNAYVKMRYAKNIRIIGITGSYGKTTTKDILFDILKTKYPVFKTQKSQNSDIGIAETILRTDLSKHSIFVCEMAAYKKGEIRASTKLLGNKIVCGIITGINEQHQALFGSLDNTKQAKFELIDAIRKNGTAVFNAEDEQVDEMITWAKEKQLRIKKVKQDSVASYKIKVPADFFRQNVALAVVAAKSIGMKNTDIQNALRSISLPDKTMEKTKKGAITLFNDTFNANPDGVYAAISAMRRTRKRRILVLQPLIELGAYSREIHEAIGEQASRVFDSILLTNKNYYESFMKGVQKGDPSTIVQISGDLPAIKHGTVLFEGKEAEQYLLGYLEN